jgi:CubicO group peptidase (beta-lactamase class C family)
VKHCLSVLLVLFVPMLLQAQTPSEKNLDALVSDALKSFDAPGAAVVIVHEDKVVYQKGVGVRELGKAEPVTESTVFQIASCTKAFLAMLIAMLMGDGLLDWDDPVHKHAPFFRLSDPFADQHVTIRDTLCHRTGLSRHDLLWYKSTLEPEEVIRRIGHVKTTTSLRSNWEYANIPFLTAGTAAALVEKRPLAESLKKRIFEPLGMTTASGNAGDFLKATNRAVGYRATEKDQLETIAPLIYDSRGAGDISASARDLGQWLRFQLGDGTFNGKRLLPAKHFHETHAPQMVVKLTQVQRDSYPEVNQLSYALGWFVQDYRGELVLSHGGSLPGFRTQTMLAPKHKLGIVVMTNRNPSALPEALTRTIVDRFLGLSDRDWNGYYAKLEAKQRAERKKKEAGIQAKRIADTKPSRELKAFAGAYEHPAYGKAEISAGKDGLLIQWSTFKVPLEHWHHDTFRNIAPGEYVLEGEFLVFNFEADGAIRSMRWLGQEFTRHKESKKSAGRD